MLLDRTNQSANIQKRIFLTIRIRTALETNFEAGVAITEQINTYSPVFNNRFGKKWQNPDVIGSFWG
ncbi:MAG: hypothetical protein IPI60_07755 [Saprospiraceae bacterium]|nr:hypothetical protein [Saprospiraceae bacterium]